MNFKDAKKNLYEECEEQLKAAGFFKKYECWYKIDIKSGNIFIVYCRSIGLSRRMELSLYVGNMMKGIQFENVRQQKYSYGSLLIRDFEVVYAEKTLGYRQYQNNEIISMEMQLKQAIQFIQMIALPVIEKIKTPRDLYEFCLIMYEQAQSSLVLPTLYILSTHLHDWAKALEFLEIEYISNEEWGMDLLKAIDESEEKRKRYRHFIPKQAAIKENIELERMNILSHNSDYFIEKHDQARQKTLFYIKKAFTVEIKKGIIKLD